MTDPGAAPASPPERLETPRLVLRCWHPADAPALKAAMDASLPELQAWMPWAREEPSAVHLVEARLVRFRGAFQRGDEWLYGIFAPDDREVLGGIGLHPRQGPGRLEIGYWLRSDVTGRGLVTEAVRALSAMALTLPGIDVLEIRCDARNARSAAVPPRAGYRLERTILADPESGAIARESLVWVRGRDAAPAPDR